jgi:outer membrane protein, multidrug efflux system
MKLQAMAISIAVGFLSSCTLGPNYHRPAVQVPQAFHAPEALPDAQAASFADLKWWEVFRDEELQSLIRKALEQNYDLRDAVTRVEASQANLAITRSDQFPQASASGDVNFTRLSRNGAFPLPPAFVATQNRNWGQAQLNLLSFEVDLWGRLRRATEAARANLLSADENRKAVVSTLVSEVAAQYFTLREFDAELEISRQTLVTRQEALKLTTSRRDHGIATDLDLKQAEQLVDTADVTISTLQQQIELTENQITLLIGENPAGRIGENPTEIVRVGSFDENALPPEVPAGLPSALLERRPDIRAAEQNLIAANANIGVAKAAYFPQLSLSGLVGGQSTQLSSLFNGPNSAWSFVPQLSQPIFTAGRLRSNVRLAEAQRDSSVVQYQRAIQTAFTEVSNALIAHQRVREARIKQEALVAVLEERKRLAYMRYQGGVDTQLNALDADRDLLQAQLDLRQIKLNELLAVVQLYKALGGGWQR